MSVILQLSPLDPLIARDGRPFGAGQGNRMRGLPWPLPSVVAGSFRTAFVKTGSEDFSGDMPQRLMRIAVAGVFPVHEQKLYFPAPNDCVAEPLINGNDIKIYRVIPDMSYSDGCDLPEGLMPVMLPADVDDFKPAEIPAWWPIDKSIDWLLGKTVGFDGSFLKSPVQEVRDHVKLDPELGAAAEGQLFSTTGLNVSHMPKFSSPAKGKFTERFAEVSLGARVNANGEFKSLDKFNRLHSLGGERRLVLWRRSLENIMGWTCPTEIRSALSEATNVRMILVTPAIFKQGWKPDLKDGRLKDFGLKLVGASLGRWNAVSGWSLAPPRGPKAIRRMVPAGSVYFFEIDKGEGEKLAEMWLESVSDDDQEQRDGFGLAVWGTW